ncbi:ADP-ribosylglycohydrolase family protein [Verrucomicrobiales bacterium BCK34]|nr:ADP-ribosylglycohydrolase family protein [Verrucomicrobiales bacterium BCK34]
MNTAAQHKAILGCLLGTAVGDSIGLPLEGVHPPRAEKLKGTETRHRLLFGRGMLSDDTEHTLMVANALLLHSNNPKRFEKRLATSFRWWLASLPAGIGLGTARAIIKLWCGFPTSKSGVYSAGNGAAMRSAIIGVHFNEDVAKREEFVVTSCRITHTDPRAEEAAIIVATAAACASRSAPTNEILETIGKLVFSDEMREGLHNLHSHLEMNSTVSEFATLHGNRGISGFAPRTVSTALFAWFRHRGDFEKMISELLSCGGDTDTVAAIAGGIAGADCGERGIPAEWINGICDWPRSIPYIRKVADKFAANPTPPPLPKLFWPAIPLRNLFFLCVVLCHGLRRLLPPY